MHVRDQHSGNSQIAQLFAVCFRTVEARVRGARSGARVRFGSDRRRRSMARVLLEIEIEHLIKHGCRARSQNKGGGAACGAVWGFEQFGLSRLARMTTEPAAALPAAAALTAHSHKDSLTSDLLNYTAFALRCTDPL